MSWQLWIVCGLLIFLALLLLLTLALILFILFTKRKQRRAPKTSFLPVYRLNDGFDIGDEASPRRVEERRRQRLRSADGPAGHLALGQMDRSAASALAVEQLLQNSLVFDSNLVPMPATNVHVLSSKRDYL